MATLPALGLSAAFTVAPSLTAAITLPALGGRAMTAVLTLPALSVSAAIAVRAANTNPATGELAWSLYTLVGDHIISLPEDLIWIDEHQWTPATVNVQYAINGKAIVQSQTRGGRPITLDGAHAWIGYATVAQLYRMSASDISLVLIAPDGRSWTVRWAPDGIRATPVIDRPSYADDEPWTVRLSFIETS